MLKGTKVKVTDREYQSGRGMLRNPEHLVGRVGIAIGRHKNSGYIKVLIPDGISWFIPEETLDVIEEANAVEL